MSSTSRRNKQTTKQRIFQVVADMMSCGDREEIEIRFQRSSEMKQVARIDELCFADSSWTEEKLLQITVRDSCVLKVAVRNGEVVGYMAYKLGTDHINLVRIAVLPAAWRSRIGTRLVESLKDKMERGKHFLSVRVDVPDHCLLAQLLLRKLGFRATEILKSEKVEYYRMIYKNTHMENY